MNNEKYMELALKEAEKAFKKEEIPVGAVIVKDGKVIAKAYNKKNKSNRVKDHAEILVIDKANKKLKNWRLEDCEIYITLEPCPMCASAIEQARIKKIITGAVNKNKTAKELTEIILKEKEWKTRVKDRECTEIINRFFKKRRWKIKKYFPGNIFFVKKSKAKYFPGNKTEEKLKQNVEKYFFVKKRKTKEHTQKSGKK